MAEYIERGEAIAVALEQLPICFEMDAVESALMNIPAADVRPVVRGHWEYHLAPLALKCAACHKKIAYKYAVESNFCPNCGADMQEVQDG